MAKLKAVSKPLAETDSKEVAATVKVIAFFKEEGAAYGIMEIEVDSELLSKHGRIAYKSNADIWSIAEGQLIKKAREIFGL